MIGATIEILTVQPLVGTVTDESGFFNISNIPVGRHFNKLHSSTKSGVDPSTISTLKAALNDNHYQESFFGKNGHQLNHIQSCDISCFYAEEGVNFIRTNYGKGHLPDKKLDEIIVKGNPRSFFRVNKGMIVHHACISKNSPY